jgi:hypothetical protein
MTNPPPVCRTASGGKNTFGSDVPIQITMPASPLVAGLNSPFSMADGSEFVYELTGLGPEWTVAATFDGGGTTYPAVLSAVRSGGGCVALSPFDYFDARNAGEVPKATWRRYSTIWLLGPRAARRCGRAMPAAVQPVPTLEAPLLAVLAGLMAGLGWLRRRRH